MLLLMGVLVAVMPLLTRLALAVMLASGAASLWALYGRTGRRWYAAIGSVFLLALWFSGQEV